MSDDDITWEQAKVAIDRAYKLDRLYDAFNDLAAQLDVGHVGWVRPEPGPPLFTMTPADWQVALAQFVADAHAEILATKSTTNRYQRPPTEG